MTKVCNECGIEKPLSEYHKHKIEKDGRCSVCKLCRCKAASNWRKNNHKKVKESYKKFGKEYNKKYKQENPDKYKLYYRKSKLKRMYGVSLDDYNKMFQKQRGCCAICGKHQSQESRALSVDHNHKTGEVRKLLCGKCNLLIGQVESNIDIIDIVFDYLKEHNDASNR